VLQNNYSGSEKKFIRFERTTQILCFTNETVFHIQPTPYSRKTGKQSYVTSALSVCLWIAHLNFWISKHFFRKLSTDRITSEDKGKGPNFLLSTFNYGNIGDAQTYEVWSVLVQGEDKPEIISCRCSSLT